MAKRAISRAPMARGPALVHETKIGALTFLSHDISALQTVHFWTARKRRFLGGALGPIDPRAGDPARAQAALPARPSSSRSLT